MGGGCRNGGSRAEFNGERIGAAVSVQVDNRWTPVHFVRARPLFLHLASEIFSGVERRRVASRISAKKVMSAGFHRIHPLDFVSGARSGGALCGR